MCVSVPCLADITPKRNHDGRCVCVNECTRVSMYSILREWIDMIVVCSCACVSAGLLTKSPFILCIFACMGVWFSMCQRALLACCCCCHCCHCYSYCCYSVVLSVRRRPVSRSNSYKYLSSFSWLLHN